MLTTYAISNTRGGFFLLGVNKSSLQSQFLKTCQILSNTNQSFTLNKIIYMVIALSTHNS